MMTRYYSREHLPRPPHPHSPKRPTIRHNPLHHVRSILLLRVLLSILSLKPSTNPGTRRPMTPNRHQTAQPHRGPTAKHSHPPGLRRNRNMSPPQHYRREPKTRYSSPNPDNPPRVLLHSPTGDRIPRSPILNRRQRLWRYLLRCHRIPRPPRNHWVYLPNCLPPPTDQIPLHIKPPLWIRSRSLILTLRRRYLTIPLHNHLLMRILLF